MSKIVTIELFGQSYTLNFEANCFHKFFIEATGIDLFEVSFEVATKMQSIKKPSTNGQASVVDVEDNISLLKGTKMYELIATSKRQDYAMGLLYAGYCADKVYNDKPVELDKDHFKKLIDRSDNSIIEKVINEYQNSKLLEEVGEA